MQVLLSQLYLQSFNNFKNENILEWNNCKSLIEKQSTISVVTHVCC